MHLHSWMHWGVIITPQPFNKRKMYMMNADKINAIQNVDKYGKLAIPERAIFDVSAIVQSISHQMVSELKWKIKESG